MFSIVLGALDGLFVGLMLIYIFTKKKHEFMLEFSDRILSFLAITGVIIGFCYDYGTKPISYAVLGALISGIVSYSICVMLDLHKQQRPGLLQVLSDAGDITIISMFVGILCGFVYGFIYS